MKIVTREKISTVRKPRAGDAPSTTTRLQPPAAFDAKKLWRERADERRKLMEKITDKRLRHTVLND